MIRDSQWHPGVVVNRPVKGFALYDTLPEAQEDAIRDRLEGVFQWQDVKYTWNRGQPIVDFGDFKMTVVDIESGGGSWKEI